MGHGAMHGGCRGSGGDLMAGGSSGRRRGGGAVYGGSTDHDPQPPAARPLTGGDHGGHECAASWTISIV